MHGNGVGKVLHHRHNLLRPIVVIRIRTAGYPVELILPIVPAVGLVAPVLMGVVLSLHIPPAPPALVAHSEILYPPWLPLSVFLPEPGHGRFSAEGHILHPFAHLLHGSTSKVTVYVRLTAHLTAKLQKLVGAKGIILYDPAPVGIDHALTPRLRSYAVLPVVLIGKTAPGPSEHGQFNVLERLHYIRAHTVDVRD